MLRKGGFWIGLVILLALAAGGGWAYYTYVCLPGQTTDDESMMTAQATRGDLVISISGSGVLTPGAKRALGFQTGGYLDEVLVTVGDQVREGDLLARLETDDLKLAVLQAEIRVREAQLNVDNVLETTSDAELANAQNALQSAQSSLAVAHYLYDTTQNSALDAATRANLLHFQHAVDRYYVLENGHDVSQERIEAAWANWSSAEADLNRALRAADMEQLEAWNRVDQAQNDVYQVQERLAKLQSGPTTATVMRAELQLERALLALEGAQSDLEAAELRAPFDGVVTVVDGMPSERVDTGALVTLIDLANPVLQFWVEESDLSGLAVGARVEVEFEALPYDLFAGEVVRIDPALATVSGRQVVQAWASLEIPSHQASRPSSIPLLGDMNAYVEVISAEARDVVLSPIQALREIGEGQYVIFVVALDGELRMRPVEVGLQNLVNAEIVSGLEAGETVRIGERVASSGLTEQGMPGMPGDIPGGMIFGGGGGGGGRGGGRP